MFKIKSLFVLIVGLLLILAGCNSSSKSSSSSSESGSESSDDKVYTITYAHDHTTTSPFQISAEKLKKELEERSDGRFKVDIFPAMQLGTSREMIESMQMGNIQMVNLPVASFSGFDKRMQLVDMPFLFPNEDTLWEVLEGDIGAELLSGLEDVGLKGVTFVAEGYKELTNKYEIHSPEDLKGKRIRTMSSPVIMDTYKAWGANPVPIDFGEVYNSLQQNVVDGQENPLLSIHDMKFYEVQDYMMMSDHSYLSYIQVVNKDWFNSLPEDLQDILIDTTLEMAQDHKQLMAEKNKEYMENIKESGIKIVELSEEEKAAFREASQPVYDQYSDELGDILDKTVKFIESKEGSE